MTRPGLVMIWMLLVTAGGASAQTFDYFGERGPAHWGDLDPQWETCAAGDRQSPVAFARDVAAPRHRRLPVHYEATHGFIFNNGHTIEVETEGHNVLALDGEAFELVQFHFHTPSEHTQGDRSFEMELHLVHRSAAGQLAVIGVFLTRGPSSGALAPIFEHLPADIGPRHELEFAFNPADFLPGLRAHSRYLGSLTTPPCSEGVRWFVMEDVMHVSDEHLARFAQLVPFNARPVQRHIR